MIKNLQVAYIIKYSLLLLAYGMGGTQFTNVPILFYRPQKIVPDPNFPEEYTFSGEYPQITSVPMVLDLYGDREIYEVMILTCGYIGKFVAYILLVGLPVKEQFQHYAVYGAVLSQGIFAALMGIFPHPLIFSIAMFMWFGSFSYLLGQIFSYTYKHFSGKMSENSVIYLNLTWPIVMLVHIFFSYYDGHWRSNAVYFTGYTNLILGIALFGIHKIIVKLEKQQDQSILQAALLATLDQNHNTNHSQQKDFFHTALNIHNDDMLIMNPLNHEIEDHSNAIDKKNHQHSSINIQTTSHNNNDNKNNTVAIGQSDILSSKEDYNKSSFEILKDNIQMFKKDKTQRTNIMIWTVVWNSVGCSFVGCVIALNRLEGNLYLNLTMSTVFELLGNVAAVYLMKRFPLKKTIITCLYIMGISYLICFSLDSWTKDNEEQSMVKVIISLLPVLIAKGTHETMWNIVIEFQRQVIRLKYHQFSFALANLFDMSITSTLPSYQYMMEKNGINQFLGYGLYALIAAKASQKFKLFNRTSYTNHHQRLSSISEFGESLAKKSEIQFYSNTENINHCYEYQQDHESSEHNHKEQLEKPLIEMELIK